MTGAGQGDLFAEAASSPTRELATGRLRAMRASAGGSLEGALGNPRHPVSYELRIGDDELPLEPLLGTCIAIRWNRRITCAECASETPRSYSGGYCYNCSQTLACCDRCIVSPELCHFHLGTCREPEWAQGFCMQPHIVYLANSSGLKVGITRERNRPGRWLDQGATQGLPLLRVQSRFHAGQWEDAIRKHVADRTDWRAMLRDTAPAVDLAAEGARLIDALEPTVRAALPPAERLADSRASTFSFPSAPRRSPVRALNLDKEATVEGKLEGSKGQYLLFDTFVFNVRRHAGYDVSLLCDGVDPGDETHDHR